MLFRLISDAKLFYAHAGLFAFSEIIFLLSLPVLFLEKGFSLSFIFLFYGLASLPGYFFTTHILRYALRMGIRKIFVVGVVLYILFGASAFLITGQNLWWCATLILLAAQAVFYWPSRHLYFAEIAHTKTVGLQSGVLSAVMTFARMVGPIVSGIIAISFDFEMVFLFGAGLMLLSVLPIVLIQTKTEAHFDLQKFQEMKNTHPIFSATRLPYIADGANSIISYLLWPVLFFLILANQNYFQLGSLMTITYAISAIIMVAVGYLFDQKHRKKLLSISICSNILAIIGRFSLLFFHPIAFVYAVQSLYSFSESALKSTFEAYWYSYSKATHTAFFTIHREMHFALGRFYACIIFAIASYFFKDVRDLWPLFVLGIPIVLIYWQKRKVDHFLE